MSSSKMFSGMSENLFSSSANVDFPAKNSWLCSLISFSSAANSLAASFSSAAFAYLSFHEKINFLMKFKEEIISTGEDSLD